MAVAFLSLSFKKSSPLKALCKFDCLFFPIRFSINCNSQDKRKAICAHCKKPGLFSWRLQKLRSCNNNNTANFLLLQFAVNFAVFLRAALALFDLWPDKAQRVALFAFRLLEARQLRALLAREPKQTQTDCFLPCFQSAEASFRALHSRTRVWVSKSTLAPIARTSKFDQQIYASAFRFFARKFLVCNIVFVSTFVAATNLLQRRNCKLRRQRKLSSRAVELASRFVSYADCKQLPLRAEFHAQSLLCSRLGGKSRLDCCFASEVTEPCTSQPQI